jgi:hypothetical protein
MTKTMTKDELYAVGLLEPDAQVRVAVALALRDDAKRREDLIALTRQMYLLRPVDDRSLEWAVWQLMATDSLARVDTFFYRKSKGTDAFLVHASEQLEALMKERTLNLKAVGELLPVLNSTALQKLSLLAANERRRRADEARVRSVFYDDCH